jgi:serine/threonine protein phosphatase 1
MALAALELAGLELVEVPPEDAEAATGEAPHTQARARAVGAMRRWLQHGGIETIESFGLTVDPQAGSEEALADLAARLRGAQPEGLETWLAGLPRFWRDGAWAAAHAAGDPGLPLEAQDPDALIWGHAASLRRARSDGVWMIHGHWIVPDVTVTPGRIAVDTGAYRSGTLSAVWLDGQTREVWQTGQGAVARRALER